MNKHMQHESNDDTNILWLLRISINALKANKTEVVNWTPNIGVIIALAEQVSLVFIFLFIVIIYL